MRRNWKRILSLLLTVAMIFTMNTSVFATEPGTIPEGDQATVEAAETTESATAETVEETKETNSEATSETTEESKTEEAAPAEKVVAETAPAATAEAAVEETAAAEETAATTEAEAVVEETEEVAAVEETVVEEAETVEEEINENRESEGNKPFADAVVTGWTLVSADGITDLSTSTNGINVTNDNENPATVSVSVDKTIYSDGVVIKTAPYVEGNARVLNFTISGTDFAFEEGEGENESLKKNQFVKITAKEAGMKLSANGEDGYFLICDGEWGKITGKQITTYEDDEFYFGPRKAETPSEKLVKAGKDGKITISVNKTWVISSDGLNFSGDGDSATSDQEVGAGDQKNIEYITLDRDDEDAGPLMRFAFTAIRFGESANATPSADKITAHEITVKPEGSLSADTYWNVWIQSEDTIVGEIAKESAVDYESGVTFSSLSDNTKYTVYAQQVSGNENGDYDESNAILYVPGPERSTDIETLESPHYFFVSDDSVEKTTYLSLKPNTKDKLTENIKFWDTTSNDSVSKDKVANVTKWEVSTNSEFGGAVELNNEYVASMSVNTYYIRPLSLNNVAAQPSEAKDVQKYATYVISADVLTGKFDAVTISADKAWKDGTVNVKDELEKALSISFDGLSDLHLPSSFTSTISTDWVIGGKTVSDGDADESLEDLGLGVSGSPYNVSVNVSIKKDETVVISENIVGTGILKVLKYEKEQTAPSENILSWNKAATGMKVTLENKNSVSQIDVLAVPAAEVTGIEGNQEKITAAYEEDLEAEALAFEKLGTATKEFGNGTFTFFIRYSASEPENASYTYKASDWTKITQTLTINEDVPTPVADQIIKDTAGTKAREVTINLKDGVDATNYRFILASANAVSAGNLKKLSDNLVIKEWSSAKNGSVSFNTFLSWNGTGWEKVNALTAKTKYTVYVVHVVSGGADADSEISNPGFDVTTTELGKITKLELKLTAPSIQYEGKEKSISENFSVTTEGNTGFDKDDFDIAIRLTPSKNAAAFDTENVPSGDDITDPMTTKGINAGDYVVRAWAKVKTDKKDDYDDENSSISSNKANLEITPASATAIIKVKDDAENVKDGVIGKGKSLAYDDIEITVSSDIVSGDVLSIKDAENLTYLVKDKALAPGKTVSFNETGEKKITVSGGKAALELSANSPEVSTNFALDLTDGKINVVDIKGLKLETTGNKLYYEAAQDEFGPMDTYFKLSNGNGEELTKEDGKYKAAEWTYRITSGNYLGWEDFKKSVSGDLAAGTKVEVSVNYTLGGETEYAKGEITVEKQPLVVKMNQDEDNLMSAKNAALKSEFTGKLTVSGLDYAEKEIEVDIGGSSVSVDSLFSTKSLTVDVSNVYADIPGYYDVTATGTLSDNYAKNYELVDGVATGSYWVVNAFKVQVYNADTGETIGDAVNAKATDAAINIDTKGIALKLSKMYLKYGNYDEEGNLLYGETVVNLNDGTTMLQTGLEITEGATGVLTLSGDFIEKFVTEFTGELAEIYVHTKASEDSDNATVVTKGTKDPTGLYTVDYIDPVTWTGLKHVATDDTKNNTKKNNWADLGVTVRYGGEILVYGTDYTLSYKNNVNVVADRTAKNAKTPQVIITGKGARKGIKLIVEFNILPANLNNIAYFTIKKPYVKLNKKVNVQKLGVLYNSYTGKKLPGTFTYTVYDASKANDSGNSTKITDETSVVKQYWLTAKKNEAKKKFPNYTATETNKGEAVIYGIPNVSKKLGVKTLLGSVNYSTSGVKVEDFFKKGSIKVTGGKPAITAVEASSVSQLKAASINAYFCTSNGAKLDSTTVSDAGTYYIAVGPLEFDSLSKNNVFEPTIKKVKVKGKSIKGMFALSEKSANYDGNYHDLTIAPTTKGTKAGVQNKDVMVYVKAPGALANTKLGTLEALGGKISGNSAALSNNKAGKYTITLVGQGNLEGSVALTYQVKAIKAKDGITGTFSNGKDTIEIGFNAAGGYDDEMIVKYNNIVLERDVDYTVTFKGANVGKEGTATIAGTGTVFTGKLKAMKFKVTEMDFANFVLKQDGVKDYVHSYYVLADKVANGNSTSENSTSENSTSNNTVSNSSAVSAASDNSTSGNSTSGNSASENEASGEGTTTSDKFDTLEEIIQVSGSKKVVLKKGTDFTITGNVISAGTNKNYKGTKTMSEWTGKTDKTS